MFRWTFLKHWLCRWQHHSCPSLVHLVLPQYLNLTWLQGPNWEWNAGIGPMAGRVMVLAGAAGPCLSSSFLLPPQSPSPPWKWNNWNELLFTRMGGSLASVPAGVSRLWFWLQGQKISVDLSICVLGFHNAVDELAEKDCPQESWRSHSGDMSWEGGELSVDFIYYKPAIISEK